ncbi:MAG: CBS domain-containing protein [Thermodesulfobacteriota bacterium]|nr:CBS domain-containing protein [Thermodesulfobacteriota bacterium]
MFKAKDIMTTDPLVLSPDDDISRAAQIMIEKGINGLPVVDKNGELVGILCQSDLIIQQKNINMPSVFTLLDGFIPLSSTHALEEEMQKMSALTVGRAMTPNPKTVEPKTSLEDIATLMVKEKFHTLPVVDKGRLVGVIGKEDVLRTMLAG